MVTVNPASELQFMNKERDTYLSFVIPCYNSSKSLKIVTDEILDVMKKNDILNFEKQRSNSCCDTRIIIFFVRFTQP